MARELLLVRHGKATQDPSYEDFARPLKDRGKRDAQRLGVWLWQQDLRPDHVVASPAERALVTAEKCCKAMDLPAACIVRDERLYLAYVETVLRVLAEVPGDTQRVLLVGHNPFCEELLEHLVARLPTLPLHEQRFKTATLAHIGLPDDWRELPAGCGTLLRLQHGRSLPRGFPYPAPFGGEQRERPAYYYQQSAVIPYRVRKGRLQVLVVGSSKRNHWVVPKGVSGPGHTLQESAREEAREEAGVQGEVLDEVLGEFTVEKWGATCNVQVFPMRVTGQIPDAEWEERHRGREWLACAEAAARVDNRALAEMIRQLPQRELPG